MKIRMLRFGKLGIREYEVLIKKFEERLRPHHKITHEVLKLRDNYRVDPQWFSKLIGRDVFDNQKNFFVLYDEQGIAIDSKDFAAKFTNWCDSPAIQSLIFIVGPPFGFSNEAKDRANCCLSLSTRTLTSDCAWLIAWEQLYRATAINAGISYHHE